MIAGVLATNTQDLAAPLLVVLQSKTGTAATKYLYSLGTRPVAQNTTAWEYLLPDALGSVRQIVDGSGNVTLAKSYEPYGTVLTSTGTASSIFGYAGEQFDTTGLIYLRARYMNPMLGIFLSRDPWNGDVMRPRSMNGFAYVEGNPINLTDSSGTIAAGLGRDAFADHYSYSCNCGWIDWEHAGDQSLPGGQGVYNSIVTLYRNIREPVSGDFDYKTFYAKVTQGIPLLGESGVEAAVYAKNHLSLDRAKNVTTGMWMTLQLGFESFQGGITAPNYVDLWKAWLQVLTRAGTNLFPAADFASSFAVEDLPSDTIAVYRVLKEWSQDDIKRICNVLSQDESWYIYQHNQDLTGRYQNFSFFEPKYACELGGACATGGSWPTELLDIVPNWQGRGIWEVLSSDIKYSGGFHGQDPIGMPKFIAKLLRLP